MMDELATFCERHRLPASVRVAWAARGLTGWTPLQAAAWAQGLAEPEKLTGPARLHWLVCGPTSAGKGVLAEVAAILRLVRGEKVIWLAPTRALAEMVHARMRQTLAGLGLRLVCATHDRPGSDGPALRGQFDLLVCVYEKMQGWLIRQPHGLAEVSLIVADELTALRDPERGGRFDLLLAMIAGSPYEPQRLGLCLPVPNLDEVADWWLGGRPGQVLASHERPRALREGVLELTSGRLRWRDRATGAEGVELLAPPAELEGWLDTAREILPETDWPPLRTASAAGAGGLAARGEPTLLFATSRPQARAWAAGLAQAFALPSAGKAVLTEAAELAARDPGHDHRLLAEALRRGVGLHHADLSPAARRLVERAYQDGQARLLVATPTLAQGMNFSALNAVHWPERMAQAPTGEWQRVPLERWRFIDQGGRAARLGEGDAPGRSLLVAWGEAQADRLWRRYITEEPEPLTSRLGDADLELGLLGALAGDVARTPANLAVLFGATLAGRSASARLGVGAPDPPALPDRVAAAIARCQALAMIKGVASAGRPDDGAFTAGDRLRLTGLGQVCAGQGITPDLLARFGPWLEDEALARALFGRDTPDAPLPAIWALALCVPPGLWPAGPRAMGSPVAGWARGWFDQRQDRPPAPLAVLLDDPGGLGGVEASALEAGWRLAGWIGREPTDQLEAHTGWTAGMLARAGESLAWLARGAAVVSLAQGRPIEFSEGWQALAVRLAAGVPPEGMTLARLKVEDLTRTGILALCADGLGEPAALADAPLELLTRHLGDPELARRLREAARLVLSRQWRQPGRGWLADSGARGRMTPARPVTAWEWRPALPSSSPTVRSAGSGERVDSPAPLDRSPQPFTMRPTNGGDRSTGLPTSLADEDCLLEIDLQSPGVVRLAGREVRLRPLSFDLLAALAERPGKVVTRAALYQRLWPEGGVEDQQLDAHRRRLARELRQVMGSAGETMLEVVRGQGLRLRLAAAHVRLFRG